MSSVLTPKPTPVTVSLAPPEEPVDGVILTSPGVSEVVAIPSAPLIVPSAL